MLAHFTQLGQELVPGMFNRVAEIVFEQETISSHGVVYSDSHM